MHPTANQRASHQKLAAIGIECAAGDAGRYASHRLSMNEYTELLNQLPKFGWSVERIEDADTEWPALEWWQDEVWILKSVWSPQDSRVYLTFLVDPQAPI